MMDSLVSSGSVCLGYNGTEDWVLTETCDVTLLESDSINFEVNIDLSDSTAV